MRRILTLIVALVCLPVLAMGAEARWLRYPAISPDGTTVVFSYKGDLYLVSAEGGEAKQLTSHAAHDYAPVWSPDGKQIAFASDRYGNFDLYLIPVTGGNPKRLTTHSSNDMPWSFTPDGKSVVYSSLMYDSAESAVFPKAVMTELYSVSVEGDRPQQILGTPAEEVSFVGKSGSFVYQDCKSGENIWRKHQTSNVAKDIWLYENGKHTKLTSFKGEDRTPRVSKDGKTIFFTSERNGSFNIYSFPIAEPEKVATVTSHKLHPVRFLTISDSNDLCYAYDGDIYVKRANAATKKLQVSVTADNGDNDLMAVKVNGGTDNAISKDGKQVAFVCRGDIFVTSTDYERVTRITTTPEAEKELAFSPDGRQLAYVSDRDGAYNIYIASLVRSEEPTFAYATLVDEKPLFKNNKTDKASPKFSPDGTELAYIDDNYKLMVLNLATGKSREITNGENWKIVHFRFKYEWSPDGKWFALTMHDNNNYPETDLGVVSAEGGKPLINITETAYYESSPSWVLGGNAILYKTECYGRRRHSNYEGSEQDAMLVFMNKHAYDTFVMSNEERELLGQAKCACCDHTKGTVVEPERFDERIVRLTPASVDIGSMALSSDGKELYYNAAYYGDMRLCKLDIKSGKVCDLGAAVGNLEWNDKEDKLFVLGSKFSVLPKGASAPKQIAVATEMVIDRAAERRYMYDNLCHDVEAQFYEKSMHNTNWALYTSVYRNFLPHISNNYDFAELLSELLGELNVSHTGCTFKGRNIETKSETANLGLIYDLDYKGDGLKVAEVVVGGPFDRAESALKAGDIITAIDGNPILKGKDFFPLLNNKVGKRVLCDVVKPNGTKAQAVAEPITNGACDTLLYWRWVKNNVKKVEKLSGGRLGYIHIWAMKDEYFRKLYSDIVGRYNNYEGVVIDTRFNPGGHLQEAIEILTTGHNYMSRIVRDKFASDMPRSRYNHPTIMIMCEANYSNAHGTPWMYKNRKIGKLVGMPVAGTMTSVNFIDMQDQSLRYGIPIVGYRDEEGNYLENSLLTPDVEVDNNKAEVVTGVDSQLETAVRTLLNDIDKR